MEGFLVLYIDVTDEGRSLLGLYYNGRQSQQNDSAFE
jgi:hypothetical protein